MTIFFFLLLLLSVCIYYARNNSADIVYLPHITQQYTKVPCSQITIIHLNLYKQLYLIWIFTKQGSLIWIFTKVTYLNKYSCIPPTKQKRKWNRNSNIIIISLLSWSRVIYPYFVSVTIISFKMEVDVALSQSGSMIKSAWGQFLKVLIATLWRMNNF